MDFNKDDVFKFVKNFERPYKGAWTVFMSLLLWIFYLPFVFEYLKVYIIFTQSTLILVNILVMISTIFYAKNKTTYFQNVNLSAIIFGLSIFMLFFSFNLASTNEAQNIIVIICYFAIYIVSALLTAIFIIRSIGSSSKNKKRPRKQNAIVGSLGAVFLYSVFRLIDSFLHVTDSNVFNSILIAFFSIILICVSTNYFLKAYFIKKYDLDEPVKIIEE